MTHTRLFLMTSFCLVACEWPAAPGSCPAVIRRAIEVEVTDARTGQPAAAGASGLVRDGAYTEPLRIVGWRGTAPNDTAITLGAGEGRVGTYDVRVERAGYGAWERQGVTPRVGVCGVQTMQLRAALTPTS